MTSVLHIIAGLGRGGAEATLARLVLASQAQCRHTVISLTDAGLHGPLLQAQGVPVHSLCWPRGRVTPAGLLALWRLIRFRRPEVVQTWMYHADLAGGVAARLAGVRGVAWGIRNSDLHPQRSSRSARLAQRLCAGLSGWVPGAIVSCSARAAQVHAALGYRADKFQIIPNGYDLRRWGEHAGARESQRQRWGVAEGVPVLGMVARWDPQKDHANLFDALALVLRVRPELVCVLVGAGMATTNEMLMQGLRARGLQQHRVVLDGPRDEVPAIMAALDLHVLSSAYGEAFPNVVAEAMACGTPCVVTDVGDAAAIVGEVGWVVPAGAATALANAILSALLPACGEGRAVLRAACRQRVEREFGLDRMVNAYLQLWSSLQPNRI